MFQEEYNSIVKDPAQIMDISLADIKGIVERYPYCQTAEVIYAKKLRELNSPLFDQQLKKAAVAVYDRNVLFQYIESQVTQEPVFDKYEATERKETPVIEAHTTQTQEMEVEDVVVENKIMEEPLAEVVEQNLVTEMKPINDINEPTEPELIDEEVIIPEIMEELPVKVVQEEIEQEIEVAAIENVEEIAAEIEIPSEIEELALENVEMEQIETETELETVVDDDDRMLSELLAASDDIETSAEDDIYDDDRPLFELPPYDIERELGTLAEEDKFELFIRKQVPEEEEVEVFQDSFMGWLERLGSPSKGVLVEMKVSNLPIKKYLQASPIAGKTNEDARQEKVIDEIIAGELARKSIQMSDQLVTETYARILVMQGKYQKAVEMYTKLSLLKPQKSDYFAALIDQIKKRIN